MNKKWLVFFFLSSIAITSCNSFKRETINTYYGVEIGGDGIKTVKFSNCERLELGKDYILL